MNSQRNYPIIILWFAVFAVFLSLLTGCGGSEPASKSQEPAVDPRFASAEALLDHYNDLAVHTTAVDPLAIHDLFYAENELQQTLLRIQRKSLPYIEVLQAIWDHFGCGLNPSTHYAPKTPDREPATMIELSADRAMALTIEADGTESHIYFVRVGHRWWVSGYTLEYDPRIAEAIDSLDIFERNLDAVAEIAPELVAAIRRGDFASIDEVRVAFGIR